MSDDQVMRVATEQFAGKSTLEERFQTAARMVDWRGPYPSNESSSFIPAVYWDSDSHEMSIPVYNCAYGYKLPWAHADFQFDSDGRLIGAEIDQSRYEPLPIGAFTLSDEDVEDPWGRPESLTHTLIMSFRSDDLLPDSVSIRMPRSKAEEISRVVEIRYRTTSDTSKPLSAGIVIHTEPPVDFVVLDEQGPVVRTNPLYNSYIVQDEDFAVRSGSWRPSGSMIRDEPFPEFEAHYQTKILLAPHTGVTLTVEIAESEQTP